MSAINSWTRANLIHFLYRLLRKQLALLESFQTLVADTVEVTKRHQLPALHERCPRFACYEPVMFKFSDLAVHFLNDSSRVSAKQSSTLMT